MALPKTIKENPFAAIGLFLTLVGVAFSVVNFIVLASVAPLSVRVKALEDHQIDPSQFATVVEKVRSIEVTLEKVADRVGVIK